MTAVERQLRNRRVRREVNERVAELTKEFGLDDPAMIVFCECGRDECMTQLVMNLSEYAAVRAVPNRWVVVSAHIDEPGDSIHARRDGYALVHHDSGRLSTEARRHRKESTSPPTTGSSQH
jgi:hypothetical protein